MNTNEVCSEEQASTLAGVSARTLQRFRESGYLTTTPSADGTVQYLRSQLVEIFGASDTHDDDGTQEHDQSPISSSQGEACARHASVVNPPDDTTQTDVGVKLNLEDVVSSNSSVSSVASTSSRSEVEIERLRNLLMIQEKMLDAKDDEIADLKNQRSWLRQRIEKLEEKSDRDQILLLQETQTIRSLISYQESRKSTFRQLLEWMGIAEPATVSALPQATGQSKQTTGTTGGRTIEVQKAANID